MSLIRIKQEGVVDWIRLVHDRSNVWAAVNRMKSTRVLKIKRMSSQEGIRSMKLVVRVSCYSNEFQVQNYISVESKTSNTTGPCFTTLSFTHLYF